LAVEAHLLARVLTRAPRPLGPKAHAVAFVVVVVATRFAPLAVAPVKAQEPGRHLRSPPLSFYHKSPHFKPERDGSWGGGGGGFDAASGAHCSVETYTPKDGSP